jgi:hypothetical protein
MTPDQLESLILRSKDPWAVQAALAALDEKERSKLSTSARKIHTQLQRNKADAAASERLRNFIAWRSGEAWSHWNARETRNSMLALFGLCPLSTLTKSNLFISYEDMPMVERIIRDRRPDWLDDWIAHELEREFSQLDFGTLRAWIREGLCRKPELDGYYQKFAAHLMRTGFYNRREEVPPLSAQLLEDPDLLADVDGLFRVESIAFNTNSWLTKGAAAHYETWPDALAKLSADGHLDRGHLLGLALDGLKLDLKQNQLSGFHNFYKRMAPTAAEQLQHQPLYIDLLCHPVGHVVKFAIEMLGDIEKKGALDRRRVLREIQGVFSNEGKGNAVAALKLISRIIARKEGDGRDVSAVLVEALRHAHADVQAQALDLLGKQAGTLDEDALDALREMHVFVSASNRPRLAALLAEAPAGAPAGENAAAAAPKAPERTEAGETREDIDYRPISGDLHDQKVLSAEEATAPILTVDELIDSLLHAVETVDSPDEVERIIDAISRLCGDYPADFEARTSALLHRLKAGRVASNGLLTNYIGIGLALLDLFHTWLTGRLHRTADPRSDYYTSDDSFVPLTAHVRAIAERVARGESRLLLSAPTHKGGWIDPAIWVERLRTLQHEQGLMESMDFRLSLLRLAPDFRDEAMMRAWDLPDPLRRIADFALGGDTLPQRGDRTSHAAWISAARCRAPHKDWRAEFAPLDLDDRLPDGLQPARYVWRSSHEKQQYEQQSWKTPEFSLAVGVEKEPGSDGRGDGVLSRLARAVGGRIATEWTALPTVALNRRLKADHYWASDLSTVWVSQWLGQIWPQNPAAACMRGAARLIPRIDENSSSWSPGFGAFQILFQRSRPWREPGHLLLCLGLIGKDADSKGLAVDALIEGIEGRLFDPAIFGSVMQRIAEGEWVKFNRLGDALMAVIQVSPLHAGVVSDALQKCLPGIDLSQKNVFRVLEVLVEAQALTGRPLGAEARETLRGIGGSGKAAKIAKQLVGP